MQKLIAIAILIGTITLNIHASQKHTTTRPRLAVIMTINGLQNYHLETFMPSLTDDGINRIITSGAYTPTATCRYMPYHTIADYASLMTGSTPHYHGIVDSTFYSLLDNKTLSAIDDARYNGINTPLTVSPRLLQATTIADQLKLSYPDSKVYSIALSAESAIMLGGHLADGAIWFDDNTGQIATTNYYNNGLPLWASKINENNQIATLANYPWLFSQPLFAYQQNPTTQHTDRNLHECGDPTNAVAQMRYLKQSPHINQLVKELAVRAVRDQHMGTDQSPDLLCIEFNVENPYSNTPFSAENEDLFMKLDQEIKSLLDIIDLSVGLDNCVIMLTAPNHYTNSTTVNNERLNQGSFNSYRSMALLNAYLMAMNGQGRWVSYYYDKNIILNKSLIEDNNIDIAVIENQVARFMLEFAGVHSAYTVSQLHNGSSSADDQISRIKNSHYKNRSGDIVFTLLPGWSETDKNNHTITSHTTANSYLPLAIWFDGINRQELSIRYEDAIPTLCHILQIPLPNASIGKIVNLKQ